MGHRTVGEVVEKRVTSAQYWKIRALGLRVAALHAEADRVAASLRAVMDEAGLTTALDYRYNDDTETLEVIGDGVSHRESGR